MQASTVQFAFFVDFQAAGLVLNAVEIRWKIVVKFKICPWNVIFFFMKNKKMVQKNKHLTIFAKFAKQLENCTYMMINKNNIQCHWNKLYNLLKRLFVAAAWPILLKRYAAQHYLVSHTIQLK